MSMYRPARTYRWLPAYVRCSAKRLASMTEGDYMDLCAKYKVGRSCVISEDDIVRIKARYEASDIDVHVALNWIDVERHMDAVEAREAKGVEAHRRKLMREIEYAQKRLADFEIRVAARKTQ